MRLYVNDDRVKSVSKSGAVAVNPNARVSIGGDPETLSPRSLYLTDLERMHAAGQADHRPFTGPLQMPFSRTWDRMRWHVEQNLAVTTQDVPATDTAPLSHPGDEVLSYRLYQGGKVYSAETLDWELAETELGPDPETNPLGIFFRDGALTIGDNVSIRGTVITHGGIYGPDLYVRGENVHFSAMDLPSLQGEEQPVQMPAAIVKDDFIILDQTRDASLQGLAVVFDRFEVDGDTYQPELAVDGNLIVRRLRLYPPDAWIHSWDWWYYRVADFHAQARWPDPSAFFPSWLEEDRQLDSTPTCVFRPPAQPVTYHWHDWSQPLYVPHPDDEGLVWELLQWKDQPRLTHRQDDVDENELVE
jgi:hypothetical protein